LYAHEGKTLDSSSDQQAHPVAQPERSLLRADHHRPVYHFLPPANWMNDPNGLIQWKGVYHVFYQYNPGGAYHHKIQWGHATSTDLVHWTHLPIALAPTPGSPDEDGCFSGCAVDNEGVPTIIYSGHRVSNPRKQQRPCTAISTDGTGGSDSLTTWQKYPGNPVIAGPPPGLDVVEFRDHSIWKEEDAWYQVIGSGIREIGGAALLYRSTDGDLHNWEYMHPLLVGDVHQVAPLWTGSMWECPDFFSLDEGHILVVSVWYAGHLYYSVYFTGTYSNSDHRFVPQHLHKLDFGASFYAPQTLRDEGGRRIMWGWLREERDEGAQLAAGWSGVMSLPRILSLRPDGMLDMRPAPELEMLRAHHWALGDIELEEPADAPAYTLPDVRGDTMEIVAEFDPGDAIEVGIVVRCSPDGREQTRVLYDCAEQHVVIDASRSSLEDTAHLSRHAGPLHLSSGETVRIRVFVDRSVVEVFANERSCATARIYPTLKDSLGISLFAHGGTARLISLDAWEMQSIWTETE
jgi:beta-fructofuranosidase